MMLSRLRSILITGLAARLALAPFFAHPFDVYVWYETGIASLSGAQPIWNFLVPYSYSFFLFVFPASAAFQVLSPVLGSYPIPLSTLNPLLNPGAPWDIAVVPGLLFDLLVKLPLIASDTVVAIVIYRVALRYLGRKELALSASSAWFLNPLVIWVSSGWGMFDTLPVLFTVLSLALLLDDRFAFSGLALVAAIAMKYYGVVLVIPLLLMAWRKGGRNGLARALASMTLGGALLFLPSLAGSVSVFDTLVVGTSQTGPAYSGLSFWTAITLYTAVPDQFLIASGLIAVSLPVLLFFFWTNRRTGGDGLYAVALYFALSLIPLLLFFRFVGENYFVWLIPFVSILGLRARRVRLLVLALSVVALVSSVTDSLLPYYLLPVAPWIGDYLVDVLSVVAPYRVASTGAVVQGFSVGKAFLSSLGVVSATLLIALVVILIREHQRSTEGRKDGETPTVEELSESTRKPILGTDASSSSDPRPRGKRTMNNTIPTGTSTAITPVNAVKCRHCPWRSGIRRVMKCSISFK